MKDLMRLVHKLIKPNIRDNFIENYQKLSVKGQTAYAKNECKPVTKM